MELIEMIKRGLIAAVPVAIVCALFIWARSGAIAEEVRSGIPTVGFSGQNPIIWIGAWAAIAFVFGVLASWGYDYLSTSWNWGPVHYLALAVGLAIVFTVLGFLKIFGGQEHPFRYEWIGLNFAFAIGFGCLIPRPVV
jgi:TRAP-type C4-dicarboxylate transport system permease small subunit